MTENKSSELEKIYCQYCELEFTDFEKWRAHEEEESKLFEVSELDLDSEQNMQVSENDQQELPTDCTVNPEIEQKKDLPYNTSNHVLPANEEKHEEKEEFTQSDNFSNKYKNIILTKIENSPSGNAAPLNKKLNVELEENRVKLKINPFHCAQCPFTYVTKEAFQRHLKFHSTCDETHVMTEKQVNILNTYFQQFGDPSKEMLLEISEATQISSHAYIQTWFKTKSLSFPKKRENELRLRNPKEYENQNLQEYKDRRLTHRSKFTEQQQAILWSYFDRNEMLSKSIANEISQKTSIPPKSISYWFHDRKRKTKRDSVQMDVKSLKSGEKTKFTSPIKDQKSLPILPQKQEKDLELTEEIKQFDDLQTQFNFLVNNVETLKKDFDDVRRTLGQGEGLAQNTQNGSFENYNSAIPYNNAFYYSRSNNRYTMMPSNPQRQV